MAALSLVLAYLLGGIPVGFLLVKWRTGRDVRSSGSGNIGATNVHRTAGNLAGIATLLLDGAKGFLAVWIAYKLSGGSVAWASAAGVSALLGHMFTPFLGFHGGKGVATFTGVFLFLAPGAIAAVAVVFIVAVATMRMISLGSILGAVTFPLAVWLISRPGGILMAAATLSCILVLYRHRENIMRIHSGTERIFTWGKKRP